MLLLIGLGLTSVKDISVSALEALKFADSIYLENYTAVLQDIEQLETLTGKRVILAKRELVESDNNEILRQAKEKIIALCVVGDVFSATTHTDLYLRAKQQNIDVKVFYNASIMTAIGVTGLQLYKFGKTTSLVFFEQDWKPQTAYDVIKQNTQNGLHTLCLLDIKVNESAKKDLALQIHNPLPPRFMSINQAIRQLQEIESLRKEHVFSDETMCVGVARIASSTQKIVFARAQELLTVDFGGPMHSLIVPAQLHFHEEECLQLYAIGRMQ